MNEQVFTYNEVCELFCEGCLYHLPDVCEQNGHYSHYLNGEKFVCRATSFKEKVARSNKKEQDLTSIQNDDTIHFKFTGHQSEIIINKPSCSTMVSP